jgi:hypothetical protein
MTCSDFFLSLLDSFGKFFLTLIGAGAGATAAFYFNRKKQHLDDEKRECADAVGAFYVLVARYSAIENFTRHYINPQGDVNKEHEFMVLYQPYPKEEILMKSLVCFANKEFRQIIYEISVSSSSYFNFTDALEERNKDMRDLFGIFHTHGFQAGLDIDRAKVEAIPQSAMVRVQTGNLVAAAAGAKKQVARSIRDLTLAMHKRFPTYPKLSTDIPDPDQEGGKRKPSTDSL